MIIGGLVKNSFVDYPHKIACVVFTTGCNFRCWYCHNSHLFVGKNKIDEEKFFDFLSSHKKFLDGVVVSGGEPTLQKDLVPFISRIKSMGFLCKLDTNGTDFETLKYLVENKLVDYVAMDIKAPFEDYPQIVGNMSQILMENVRKSAKYLLENHVDYEFRTTLSPDITYEQLDRLCEEIKGAKCYSIQKYRQVEQNEKNMSEQGREYHQKALEIAKKHIENVQLKGVD